MRKKMMQPFDKVSTITIAVKDQDEALTWFTQVLGFEKRMDQRGSGMRWLTVAPPQQAEVEFLLASWFPDLVGKNAPSVLSTRDCQGGYEELKGRGVEFTQAPKPMPWGIQAVFVDLYGNKYALVQESAQAVTSEAEKKALGLKDVPTFAKSPLPGTVEPA
jgi:predicted enzyme related to lactoylglutathione lyase